MIDPEDVAQASRRDLIGAAVAVGSAVSIGAGGPARAAAGGPAKPARILAFGASNTWGFQAPAPGARAFRRLPFAETWPGVVQRRLGRRVEVLVDAMPGRTVDLDRTDMARGGVDAADFNGMKTLGAAIVRAAPLDMVILQLGSNDLLSDKSLDPETLVARIVALARVAQTFRMPAPLDGMAEPLTVAALSPPAFSAQPSNPAWRADEARRARVPALLAAAAAEHGLLAIDAAVSIPDPGADGLHFGPEAHVRLGRHVAEAIRGRLRPHG